MQSLPKIHQLVIFEAAARAGSINAAARKLGKPQSTLSRAIKELEETLGMELIERGGKGIALTPAGEAFLTYASSAVRTLRQAVEETAAIGGRAQRSILFAVPPILSRSILNAAMVRLMRSEPSCQIKVEVAGLKTSLDRMKKGLIDFAVGCPGEEDDLQDYVTEPLMSCALVVACARGHRLAQARHFDDLRSADWLVSADFELCSRLRPELLGIEPRHRIDSDGYFVANQMVAKNDFLAVLSAVQVRRHSDYLTTISVDGFPVHARYVLVYPKARPRSRLTERMLTYLHQEADDYDWDSLTPSRGAEEPFRSLEHDMGKAADSAVQASQP